jgi:hypothetical protein
MWVKPGSLNLARGFNGDRRSLNSSLARIDARLRYEIQCGVFGVVLNQSIDLLHLIVLLDKIGEQSLVGPIGIIVTFNCSGSGFGGHDWPPLCLNCAFTIRALRAEHIQRQTDFEVSLSADLYLGPAMEGEEDDLRLKM